MNLTSKQTFELNSNKLDLGNCGTDGIPAPLLYVGNYSIGGPDDEDLTAHLLAYTGKTSVHGAKKCCYSFMVRIGDSYTYYYRDHLCEVDDLISALRAKHGYKPFA